MGSSINDVTVLGGWGQGFCDDSTKASVIKRVTIGEGGSKIVRVTRWFGQKVAASFVKVALFVAIFLFFIFSLLIT